MVLMLIVTLLMAAVIIVPLLLSGARRLVLRNGRPGWLRHLVVRTTTGGGNGAGAAVAELAAALNPNKRVEIEQRRTDQLIRHDSEAGAPPHAIVDLTAGRAVIRSR
ncbi:DUF6191 domain-containing protein [Streptomyces celluloflavus]|uniref:DUF6191 domain-containing protein n=1 Tax=Streptomyces celluloflavus TaxID=58344 RepID=UPI00368E3848